MGEVEFGEQLKKARESREITQQTLADALYVTRQTVSRWESGSRFPDLSTIKQIARILDISVGELVAAEKPQIIVEKTVSQIDTVENTAVIALYAAIVISYAISLLGTILRLPVIMQILPADVWLMSVQFICVVFGLFIFAFGLVTGVCGKQSPGKTGFIICAFWLLCILSDYSKIPVTGAGTMISTTLISIPGVIGVIVSYLFYFRNNTTVRWGIYAVSAWGILRALFTLGSMLVSANQYITAETALSAVLSICVYVLFVFQTYILKRKRFADHQPQRDERA